MARLSKILVGLSLVALVAACTPAAAPSPTTAPSKPATQPTSAPASKPAATSAPAKQASKPAATAADITIPKPSGDLKVRWGFSSSMGFSDLPVWITGQRLNKEGWQVETIPFAQSELATEAIAKGEVQFASGATFSAMKAVQNGAKILLTNDKNLNEWVLASTPALKECADLNGKRLAVHSQGAVSTAMVKNWVTATCNGSPNYLVIAGSENRAAALMNGQIDSTPLELADWVNIDTQQPGKFHLLENFSKGLPDLSTTASYANAEWVSKNKEVATAFIAELVKTNRMIKENPQLIADAAKQHLKELDEKALPKVVEAYNATDAFPPNGGLTERKVEYSIEFFTEAGQLDPGLTVSQVADLSILKGAIELIGEVPGKP